MLYLASQSPRRRMLLRRLGIPFRVVPSGYEEDNGAATAPARLVRRHAVSKARHARLPRRARGIILGADTIVYFRRRILGKPKTMAEARHMLWQMSGRSHWVYTGFCLIDLRAGRRVAGYEKTKVTFRPMSEATIRRLSTRMAPLDKAGGYALQEDRGELIERIEGSESNVIGLPLERLSLELRRLAAGT